MMMNWLMNEESGQGMVEYGLILVLVSIVAIVALGSVGDTLGKKFGEINKSLDKSGSKD